ncbi:pancreatic lipase-related protein 2 isoform X4 [Halyomorpha halys]|uniref:pancreatic lipase-related protein 2 isoform X4 n=1 Tax=Halyomorpha halys TaxID=286706 RepID=UPI0006D4F1C1|nr:pancreatic lipase-related protein 2-like isoform X3 [Halyomorpha halys]
MAKFFKKSVEKGLNAMFLRVLSPKNNGKDNKVVPDLLLDDERILYLPTTDAGSKCDWTFKSKDVALNDEDSFPSLENTLNEDLKNVFFIHGFYESVDSMSVRNVLNGYLERGDHNVLLLDWSVVGRLNYLQDYIYLKNIAERASKALQSMERLGLIRQEDLHIVGNSMGAHLAALVARNLGSVRRLTGLDPAGPLFKWKIIRNSEICKNDATFVDIIHTAMSRFGMRGKCGDVDFYPNGGLCFQPGCKRSYSLSVLDSKRLCSHWRCWRYFVESLTREDAFLAAAADSWEDFKKGNTRDVIPMGYCTPPDSSGSYFLQTSDRSPYGKGEDGLKYTDVTCK